MPEKSFSLIALPVLPGGMTEDFQKFYRLVNNKIQPNFNAKWALYSIIDGASLVEFEVREGCF